MNDIDFVKIFQQQEPHEQVHSKQPKQGGKNTTSSMVVIPFLILLTFTIGLLSGLYVRSNPQNKIALKTNNLRPYNITDPIKIEPLDTVDNQKNQEKTTITKESDNILTPVHTENKNIGNNETYLIWAKTSSDQEKIYREGLFLKEKKLPVFLAVNGSKLKVYVGPIQGRHKAYKILSQIKQYPSFKGAILHKKN